MVKWNLIAVLADYNGATASNAVFRSTVKKVRANAVKTLDSSSPPAVS
jgi:hypothetical protein